MIDLSKHSLREKRELTVALIEKKKIEIERNPFALADILYPKYKLKWFHEQWFDDYISDEEENLCLGPREFAKTTIRGVIGSIWDMVKNPNIQIGVVSDTNPQAKYFISETKLHLEKNKLLHTLYPHLVPGDIWTSNELKIMGAIDIKKGASIMAFGYGGGTGADFDKIIADDIVDFENSRIKTRRDNLENWVGMSLLPMLRSGGKIRWNGTRYHQDDYYGRLLAKGIRTNTESHKAIMEDGTSMWPELWPIEKLMEKKTRMGSVRFNAQYQNDTKLMAEGQIILRQWFKYIDMNKVPEKIRIIQINDLAISKSDKANWFVESTFGFDKEGNIYMMDMDRNRYSWHEQKAALRRNNDKWKSRAGQVGIYIEGNQYQTVLAQEMDTDIDLSITSFTTVQDKVTALRGISTKFENGKFFFVNSLPGLDIIEDELCAFPDGENDDICDTISGIQKVMTLRGPRARYI